MISEVVSAALHAFWAAGASAAATSIAQSLVKNAGGNDFHGTWKSYSSGFTAQQPVAQQSITQQPVAQYPVAQSQAPRPVSCYQPSYYQPKQAQPQQQTLFEKIDYDEYRV